MNIGYINAINTNSAPVLSKTNTISFGAKVNRDGLYALSEAGATINRVFPEHYVKERDMMMTVLKSVISKQPAYDDKTYTMDKFCELTRFYATSKYLPESYKAEFIDNQLLGFQGKKLEKMIDMVDLSEIPHKEKEQFIEAIKDAYVNGASYNSQLSFQKTKIYFNTVKKFFGFNQLTDLKIALSNSQ